MGRVEFSDPGRVPIAEGQDVGASRHASPPVLGRDWRLGYIFTLPLVVVLIALVAYPFFSGIVLSFQNKTIGGDARWIGLDNYRELLFGSQYASVFWNTVKVSLI
jgi:ABC-type sugar transport system permease subunit